ncbi:glutathione S-transferase family protein [Novosphingobium umbonatum]|uniref:Glutathione S-transferase family protein n=1 Tax=Novosphingobium umbonatum TaxID=1908524 RepID=A0A3S2Y990_9SPHN|nr:glutathione S-transferase family protein [Novosphingobium umbonatum]RVU06409.1 glutathione S-transferase family protein [Novosphingobium umbonatum]
MELMGALFSPFVRKAALVLAEKGLAFENPPFSFAEPSEDFLAASPFRKIPALKDGDFLISDSTAIAAYLDALHPEPALYPAEPRARARAVWFEEVADTIMVPKAGPAIYNRFVVPRMFGKPGDEGAAVAAMKAFASAMDYLEASVPDDGWLAGDFSIGDIAVGSVLRTLDYIGESLAVSRYPRVASWYGRLTARPAWQAVAELEAAAFAAA